MNVAQETLGFRRACLSHALSLLMSAFALPIPPVSLTTHLHRPTERSPTARGQRTEDCFRGQRTEDRGQKKRRVATQPSVISLPSSVFWNLSSVICPLTRI